MDTAIAASGHEWCKGGVRACSEPVLTGQVTPAARIRTVTYPGCPGQRRKVGAEGKTSQSWRAKAGVGVGEAE